MNYEQNLVLRVLLCFIPISLFSFILTPLTIYGSYVFLFPFTPSLEGNIITVSNLGFRIIEACVASFAYYLIWALTMLTKGITWKNRFLMILYGSLMIYALNILRIDFLVYTMVRHGPEMFNIVHTFTWKFFSGIFVALVWIFLVWYFKISNIPIYSDIKTLLDSYRK